jgi:Right handed beta helix region/Protein of unknown function (DUF1565)
MRLSFRLVFIVELLGVCAHAATYYVANGGNDSNPGSLSAPFRTLARGVQAAHKGDVVTVEDGVYGHENAVTGGDRSSTEASPVTLGNSGTPSAWITIQAQHKWAAVLDCEMICDAYIDLHNASYVVIQNFVIKRGYREGIHSNDAAHHIVLEGNQIEYIANRVTAVNMGLDGMYTNPNCHDFIIDANMFHDIGRTNPSQLDHGLYLHGSNFTITNNVFYNIRNGWSIQLADGLNNVEIANNTFAFPNASHQTGQIMMWNTLTNLVIRNNLFFQPVSAAIATFESTAFNCAIDHNLVFSAATIMLNSIGCAVGSNQLGVDPLLINTGVAPYDFGLLPGSPAIGAGAVVPGIIWSFDRSIRPAGVSPDIGAFAFIPGSP